MSLRKSFQYRFIIMLAFISIGCTKRDQPKGLFDNDFKYK